MIHPAILARTVGSSWRGVHVQWGLPAWVLPTVHDAVRQRADAGLAAAGERFCRVFIDATTTGYSTLDVDRSGRYGHGDGTVSPTQTVWGRLHELLYLVDPVRASISVHVRDSCPVHGPATEAAARAFVAAHGPRHTSAVPLTCPWGVTDTRTGEPEHAHPVSGCGCLCTGLRATVWAARLHFALDDDRPGRIAGVLHRAADAPDGPDLGRIGLLLAEPAAVTDAYLALREGDSCGMTHEDALAAARAMFGHRAAVPLTR